MKRLGPYEELCNLSFVVGAQNVLQPEEADDAESQQDILKEAETCGIVEKVRVGLMASTLCKIKPSVLV